MVEVPRPPGAFGGVFVRLCNNSCCEAWKLVSALLYWALSASSLAVESADWRTVFTDKSRGDSRFNRPAAAAGCLTVFATRWLMFVCSAEDVWMLDRVLPPTLDAVDV